MKKLNLAFIYSLRHVYPQADKPQTQLETDFDDIETIDCIVKHLKNLNINVIPVESNAESYLNLYKRKNEIDLVFNYSEGFCGTERLAQTPTILEILGLRYTGSSPFAQSIASNKALLTSYLDKYGINTPKSVEVKNILAIDNNKFNFPLIVKPAGMGCSAGITNKSIVNNLSQLKKQVRSILKNFTQPALVQSFLPGREFSLGMIGNPPKFFPIIEPDHTKLPKGYKPIDSLETKWVFEEEDGHDYLICPAKIDTRLKNKLENLCLSVWQTLDLRDFCRIDVRGDGKGNYYVLDVNSPPGFMPPEISKSSYFPLGARKCGLGYEELLKLAMNTALMRYNLKKYLIR